MYNKSTRHRDTANKPYCCSTRTRDNKASNAVTQYVYENLYKYIYKEPYVVENTVAQKAGIDIWDADTNVTIDEKCRLSDIEKGIMGNTFAVELGWINNQRNGEHVRMRGWGLSSYQSPTYYNFIWLGEVGVNRIARLRKEHIRKAECLFVKKTDMQKFLCKTMGYEDDIWRTVNQMWDRGIDKRYIRNKRRYPLFHLTRSWKLNECPVNAVIPKRILENLSSAHYYVYPNRYEVIEY